MTTSCKAYNPLWNIPVKNLNMTYRSPKVICSIQFPGAETSTDVRICRIRTTNLQEVCYTDRTIGSVPTLLWWRIILFGAILPGLQQRKHWNPTLLTPHKEIKWFSKQLSISRPWCYYHQYTPVDGVKDNNVRARWYHVCLLPLQNV